MRKYFKLVLKLISQCPTEEQNLYFGLCLFYLTKIICNIADTYNLTESTLKIKINNKLKEVIQSERR